MQELQQALDELKGLHQKILHRPAPPLGAQSLIPFPPGVDPLEHALFEVQRLKEISERMSLAPQPTAWVPMADCYTTKDEFVALVELPGVKREDLKVFVAGTECVVRGERKPPKNLARINPLALERQWGPFERRFLAPFGAELDEMKARTVDGVLELRIPLKTAVVPKEHLVEVW